MVDTVESTNLNSNTLCPLCSTAFGYDGKSCSHCSMEITGHTKTHFQYYVIDFFANNPKLNHPSDILDNRELVPEERGVYGWYFDIVPAKLPKDLKYIKVGGMCLLYIGIAGGDLSKDGNLNKRLIGDHLKGNSNGSTLAKSLHAVLDIPKANKEERTEWMKSHMKVAWMINQNPDQVETKIINRYGHVLPFNLKKNEDKNPFNDTLTKLRGKV